MANAPASASGRTLVAEKKGMNVLVYKLAKSPLQRVPDKSAKKVSVEDNIGEGIHIHWHNMRFEMTVADFLLLSRHLQGIKDELSWE